MIKNVRYLFAIMLCIANMIVYGLKVNISTIIFGMVKKQKVTESTAHVECPQFDDVSNPAVDVEGPFDWSSTQQGLVVSLYFAGYLLGMFPSGYFADRFNTKWVLLICVFMNATLTLLTPICCSWIEVLYANRFLLGFVSSANLPIVNVLVGKWVVYEEKSMWVGIIYGGTSLGTVISILSSGWIFNQLGWEMVFYIQGILPFIWVVLFAIFFADNPETQTYITEEERELLVNSYGHRAVVTKKLAVPWKAMFTSVPFLGLIVTNCLGNFCWYFLLTQMALYMNKILRFDIKSNATINCLPYLVSAVTNSLLGKFLDFGRRKEWWTQTGARKLAVGISCIPPIIFMIAIAYIGCHRTVTVVLLCLAIITSGAIFVGHLCNQNDLAPNYAGIMMGITNTPGTISALVMPTLVGVLTEKGHTFQNWRYAFWINIIAQALAFCTFMIFGSAEIQPWNYPDGQIPSQPTK